MQTGILLAFSAYFIFSCADASIKLVGASLPVFEIGFFVALFALVPTLLAKRPGDRWADILVPQNPVLVAVRMGVGTAGGMFAVYAFTTLPLAEAYALIFLSPLFVTVLSAAVLKEPIGRKRWGAVTVGLAGVLLVVRPGLRAVEAGHLAAVGAAMMGAVSTVVLRRLGSGERRITLIGSVLASGVVANGILMLPVFVSPSAAALPVLLFAGLCCGLGHFAMVMAARLVPASTIAPIHYSQILWATALGALFFGEVPDAVAVCGMGLVALSGLFTFLREETVAGRQKRLDVRRRGAAVGERALARLLRQS